MEQFELWGRIVAPLFDAGESFDRNATGVQVRHELGRGNDESSAGSAREALRFTCGCISVVSVEKQADRAMLVSWSDATLGHFADQRWVCSKSRCAGHCALTHSVIGRGDRVYKPQSRGLRFPAIASTMILAVALERLAGQEARA